MSAQAGVFAFDGGAVLGGTARRLAGVLEPFGPDGGGVHTDAGLVMAARVLHVTAEDCEEIQPLVSPRGNVVTWDGRLDNREDLRLLVRQDLRGGDGDAALALTALERWGVDGLPRLIGDWSLAFWDAAARTLYLASDFVGARPLYYIADEERVRWSSTLSALVAPVRDIADLDPRFVVGFLTFAMPPDVTPYPDVRSVPPAHVLSWNASGSCVRRRFWSLSAARLRDADPRASADELRRLLTESVRARLRSTRPVWSELSGGLDSSTIVCLAQGVLAQPACDAPALRTISYISDASRESDERPFISTVEAAIGCRGLHISVDTSLGAVDEERGWTTPLHVRDTGLEMLRAVAAGGGRTVLSGSGGDLFMVNAVDNSLAAIDALTLDLDPMRLLHELRAWSRAAQKPVWALASRMLAQCAPASIRRARAPWQILAAHGERRRGALHEAAANVLLLRPGAVDLWRSEIERRARQRRSLRDVSRLALLEGVERAAEGRAFQSPSELPGVSMTFPYTHRPLVEFVASLPSRLMAAPGQPRRLMHLAIDQILPERISRRFSKGYAAPLLTRHGRTLSRVYRGRLDRLATVAGGYVDRDRLAAALERLEQGGSGAQGNLPMILNFERWFELAGAAKTSARECPYERR